MMKKIQMRTINIENTPLALSVYSVREKALEMHDAGMLEIILCLSGSVRFAYAHEEFTLNAGEYISVDRDAYYLYSDCDNLCVSFYIDLKAFDYKYPNIEHQLFVCEGCEQATSIYPSVYHNQLRGKLITILKLLLNEDSGNNAQRITKLTGSIVDLFELHFNITLYHSGRTEMNMDALNRCEEIYAYVDTHYDEKITLGELAKHLNLSASYLSEFMLSNSLGFRKMLAYIRANKSEWYLINTDLTIVEISEECGFSDPQYYYKAFKEWYKGTPKQFRKKYVSHSNDDTIYHELHIVGNIVEEMLVKHYIDTFENL